MRKLRPFAWVIIAINLYFIGFFFWDYDVNADATANGIGLMVLIFWLAMLNTVLYVIFRVTSGKKSQVSNSLETQLREIERLKADGLITEEEYASKRKSILGA
jgi:uncharacterized membrane protein